MVRIHSCPPRRSDLLLVLVIEVFRPDNDYEHEHEADQIARSLFDQLIALTRRPLSGTFVHFATWSRLIFQSFELGALGLA